MIASHAIEYETYESEENSLSLYVTDDAKKRETIAHLLEDVVYIEGTVTVAF